MVIDEQQRHRLHGRLDEVLGTEEAAILMGHLPPVGWADVATRHDLDHAVTVLRHEVRSEVSGVREELHKELGAIRSDLLANHRQMIFAIIASQFTAVSLAFVATSL